MKYSCEKWKDIMNTTQMNYANMLKRLRFEKKFGDTILVYYSISLIVYPLTSLFYPKFFDNKCATYFGIILSIVLLVYSLINSNANYSNRIVAAESVMNTVKNLKRNLNDHTLGLYVKNYNQEVDNAEFRDDIDFFHTLVQKCKEYNICILFYRSKIKKLIEQPTISDEKKEEYKKLKNYLSEVNVAKQFGKIIVINLVRLLVIFAPIAIFVLCVLSTVVSPQLFSFS